MSDDTLIADLIAAGTPPMLVQRVAMEVMRAQLEREALERRKEQDRERQSRRRRFASRDVTGLHEQPVTNRDVTAAPAPALDGRPPLPTPTPPTLNPSPAPVSEAVASAPAAAGPKSEGRELSTSDRIWVEFPAILADMGKRSEASVRKWLGKLLAKYAAEDVFQALSATVANGTGDPFGYAIRILNPIRPKSRQPLRRSAADSWASDAAEAHHELNGGRHDERPFDTDAGPRHRSGKPGGRRPYEPAAQQAGADPWGVATLRLVGGGRA
ncbi:hypothetical protein ACQKQD_18825 [Methylobacterium sp. NPDC080182]|uniref:hypothetical protein n=1 Tax=Methylobacterium sp. NPDC080182 TaxID=3390590 RepID=UPI003D02C17C